MGINPRSVSLAWAVPEPVGTEQEDSSVVGLVMKRACDVQGWSPRWGNRWKLGIGKVFLLRKTCVKVVL